MKTNLIILLIATGIFNLSTGCKKSNPYSDNGLPPPTQTGQGMFACKINGDPWISDHGLGNIGGALRPDSFDIMGTRRYKDGNVERLLIRLFETFDPLVKTYSLNDPVAAYAVYHTTNGRACFSDSGSGYGDVIEKKVTGGTIIFSKIDTANRIIAGTFNFYVPTDYCDTLKITDGRFDIKY